MIRPQPTSTLFPYTTLFRSALRRRDAQDVPGPRRTHARLYRLGRRERQDRVEQQGAILRLERRSEEHTSELQSRGHLVCRLLLEKKKRYAFVLNVSETIA